MEIINLLFSIICAVGSIVGIYYILKFLIGYFIEIVYEKTEGVVDKINRKINQETLIDKIFELTDKHGGLWRVDFIGYDITEFTIWSKKGTSYTYSFNELGYSNIKTSNYEFLTKLKKSVMSRGGLYHSVTKTRGGYLGSFSTTNDGQSYSADYDIATYIVEIHLYSQEYYNLYRPYESSIPKKKYKNI